MKIRPFENYMLLRKVLPTTRGRLHLPETAHSTQDWVQWIVLEKGPDAPAYVEEGMSVLISGGHLDQVGEDTFLVRSDRLLGQVVEGGAHAIAS